MAGEIELSLEETNKLRAQIGLPLIPIPEKETKSEENVSGKAELSIEETNKLRISLGLRPIPIPESGSKLRDSEKKTIPEESKKTPKEATSHSFAPKKTFYNEVGSTDSWLENIGKRVLKTEKLLSSVEPNEEADLKVAHSAKGMSLVKEGDVFVLEDAGILDEEKDVLSNEVLKKEAKIREHINEKRKHDIIQFGKPTEEDEEPEESEIAVQGSTIFLDQVKEEPAPKGNTVQFADLFEEDQKPRRSIVMKKMKKRSKAASLKKRERNEEEIQISEPMVTTLLDVDLEVEDDLQNMLAQSRSKKQKQRKTMSAEEIANEVQLHNRLDVQAEVSGVVYDDTADFLSSLGSGDKKKEISVESTEKESVNLAIKAEEIKKEVDEMVEDTTGASVEREEEAESVGHFTSLLSTLKYLKANNGISEALELEKESQKMQRASYRDADLAKLKISIEERIVREELELDTSYKSLPKEEKEVVFDRVLNERLVSKGVVAALPKLGKYSRYKQEDRLSTYNPQVKLKYKDDKGQELNTKQAFKHLSHQFHGVGPSKKKVKKVKQEERVTRLV